MSIYLSRLENAEELLDRVILDETKYSNFILNVSLYDLWLLAVSRPTNLKLRRVIQMQAKCLRGEKLFRILNIPAMEMGGY